MVSDSAVIENSAWKLIFVVYNVTLHSHLYRILTPSGSNFLDFGSVVVNAPTVRTIQLENLSSQRLSLELSASQPEDVEIYLKADDVDKPSPSRVAALSNHPLQLTGKYAEELERSVSIAHGRELKERFMESLQENEAQNKEERDSGLVNGNKTKGKRDKSLARGVVSADIEAKQSVAAAVATALKKGGRGRPVLVCFICAY